MEPLYELLAPYFDRPEAPSDHLPPPSANDTSTASYLTRLSSLSLSDLASTEPASLLHSAQTHLRSLQALSKRSQKAVIASSSHLSNLTSILPSLGSQTRELHDGIPELESAASDFATKYSRSTENAVLDRRKRTLLLSRNVDRVSDVLELPTLLSSTVSAAQTTSTSSSSSMTTSYASALDLHAHIRRLNGLYPNSELVGSIMKQAESEIQNLTTILITSLQSPSLKLAGAMRTIGWLRRVAPDLAEDGYAPTKSLATSAKALTVSKDAQSEDGALGSVFLICRLRTLHTTLNALDPLRELANQETTRRQAGLHIKLLQQQVSASALGSQSERYVKRYIEIFREQSFNIISMYKSIFPSALPTADISGPLDDWKDASPALPSPLASFAIHLVEMLSSELQLYLPNIADKQARESLLTQVLYCAGSLGRLGADFGMMIALLEVDMAAHAENDLESTHADPEWEQVMKKHRIQASRLEVLSRGVGGRKASGDVLSPPPLSA
ncbi:hypothetical protein LTR09_002490 [Extremus antarcticus]|uniref:Conserved oligomeric Golgi complex subunit 8 n=1 Tax=Extremus antarcticus TaxID=702011 RepID=A0AAJ0GFU2_9PEZI|nr:hypothetical protein LTR09_002490 [Extremus antarcticus]